MWHQKILGLRAVDRVAKTPTANDLVPATVTTLRLISRQTRTALTTGSNRANEHTVPEFVACDTRSKFLYHSNRFVTDDQPGLDWILASDDMQISTADRRQRYSNSSFTDTGVRAVHFFYAHLIDTAEHVGSHFFHG